MLRLSRESDLGIVLMTRFAAHGPSRVVTARELASETGVSLPMTSKVLKRLARSGLLVSQLGVKGGYAIAGPPETLSVADVLSAMDGPIALTDCIEHAPRACDQEPICQIRANWQLINRRVVETLAAISLAEMAGPLETVPPGAQPLHRGSSPERRNTS